MPELILDDSRDWVVRRTKDGSIRWSGTIAGEVYIVTIPEALAESIYWELKSDTLTSMGMLLSRVRKAVS